LKSVTYPNGITKSVQFKRRIRRTFKIEEITKHNFILTPGRYVGIKDEEDDGIPFEEKIATLTAELKAQMQESAILDREITSQLAKIGITL